jgi:ubiquinone/menaquinone biosynthesis C-methylase UbiE
LYTDQVVAIDIRQDELDEAPTGFEKILMDATHLKFKDNSFDHVTSFYTLMFMNAEDQKSAILEATRVLRYGGELHIWDCDIMSAFPEPFCVDVVVQLPNEKISTTYGVGKMDAQDKNSIVELCLHSGLKLITQHSSKYGFYLLFKKER